jgi:hypothetical protein
MMMHALIKGGMRAAYERKPIDTMWRGDYHPNQNGFFELSEDDLYAEDFPKKFNKHLIKVPLKRLNCLNYQYPMRIIFMNRNYEEVKRSYEKMIQEGIIDKRKPPELFIQAIPHILGVLINKNINRKSIKTFDVFDYENVIAYPEAHFDLLKKHGWPINAQKAAAIPNANLKHF